MALVADDDEYFRMAVSAILRDRLGFAEVIETGSFDEAIERLETAKQIALAIFDLSMPGMVGPAALREIRDSFDVDKLAVVSASQSRADILASLDAGVHGYVSKGQGVAALNTALQQILDGEVVVPRVLTELTAKAGEDTAPRASAAASAQLPRLTPRQLDVLKMLVEGKSNKEIARALALGHSTVKVHLAALFTKLGVTTRAAAAVAGARALPTLSTSGRDSDAGTSDGRPAPSPRE